MLHFQQKGQFYGVDSARNHLCFQRGIWRGSRKNAFRGDGNRAETSKTRAANDFCWGVRRPINPKPATSIWTSTKITQANASIIDQSKIREQLVPASGISIRMLEL